MHLFKEAVPHLPALHKDQGLDLHLTETDKTRGTEAAKGDLGWRSAWFLSKARGCYPKPL